MFPVPYFVVASQERYILMPIALTAAIVTSNRYPRTANQDVALQAPPMGAMAQA